MKKLIFVLTIFIAIEGCKSKDKPTVDEIKPTETPATTTTSTEEVTSDLTTIQWLDSTYLDMGKLKKGSEMEIIFRFKNTGNKPLVIADVTAGCGCTIPEKPTEPYAPGKEGVIKAKFDSKSQSIGEHRKNVTVTANTSPETIHSLTFRVDVKE